MNVGNLTMAQTSDIPYHILATTYQQYLRLASLQGANDKISNAVAELPIFPHYSFDLSALYAGVDGQKFSVDHPRGLKSNGTKSYSKPHQYLKFISGDGFKLTIFLSIFHFFCQFDVHPKLTSVDTAMNVKLESIIHFIDDFPLRSQTLS